MTTFTETQRFRQWWVWVFLFGLPFFLGVLVLFTIDRAASPQNWLFPFLLAAPAVIPILIWRLDTRCDSDGIHYRVFPFIRWRTIPWSAIRKAYIRQYEFVGYGIRWDFTMWYYNVGGNQGLQLIKTDGSQLLIGTQRPDELQRFLEERATLTTT